MYEVHFYRDANGTWINGKGTICKAVGCGNMQTAQKEQRR